MLFHNCGAAGWALVSLEGLSTVSKFQDLKPWSASETKPSQVAIPISRHSRLGAHNCKSETSVQPRETSQLEGRGGASALRVNFAPCEVEVAEAA